MNDEWRFYNSLREIISYINNNLPNKVLCRSDDINPFSHTAASISAADDFENFKTKTRKISTNERISTEKS